MGDFWSDTSRAVLRGEGNVELRLVIPLLQALGYDDADIDSKFPVVFQEGRLGRKPEADFVCFYGPLHNRDTSLLVVEAKKPGEALLDGKTQGESYAANLKVPLLLLTNGETLEVWQLRATQESACVLNIPVSSLAAERGNIERLLGKAAVYDYCRSFHVKTILEASADYGRFETAELKRILRHEPSIVRTLRRVADGEQPAGIETGRLLAECPSGAIVVASSGYGKTTLARQLLRQAIEERWRASRTLLPFDVPLADLEQSGLSIPAFMRERLSAHCPGVTLASLLTMLRDVGATILCDGFDRTTLSFQNKVSTELVNLLRDYPCVQLFIFSRAALKPAISLPLLDLQHLSDEQMRELEKVILSDGSAAYFSVIGMMPPTLRALCDNPLLLRLALEYWKRENDFPRKIELLFRSWLNNVLETEPSDHASVAYREHALTLLSRATFASPITTLEAIALFKKHDLPPAVLNELIGCNAARVGGSVIEVQHEALADYLRAKALASMPDDEVLSLLPNLPMPADSFFPVLLVAQLRTRRLQSALWKHLSEVSLGVYLDALRYRFDISGELGQLDPTKLSEEYLDDLIDGIEGPLNGFFPKLCEAVLANLTGDGNAILAATGRVHAHPGALEYELHAMEPNGARVTVAMPSFRGTVRGVNLNSARYRIDSARLLGMTLLRDAVLEAVNHLQMKGGPGWAAERLIGRVRYLAKKRYVAINLTDSLDTIDMILKPHADAWVIDGAFPAQERFSIRSLLGDIATLRAAGKSELDPWWLRLGWKDGAMLQDEDVIRRVLDEEHRRVQLVFAEVVHNTFPSVARQMSSLTRLPIRWKLTVVRQDRTIGTSTVYFHWLPVATWNDAGADVAFTDQGVSFPDGKEVFDELARLNRSSSRIDHFGGFTQLSLYDGRHWNGRFDGATSVTHEVCSLLKDELKHLFKALPHSDGAF
jgi:Type I restriction enzyme R protein N terminus (HSDR_N)